MLDPLPVESVLPDILAALRARGNVVLKAPTGAGKTTRVPPALLAEGLASTGLIIVLEPRRLAAQTAARRMAAEHGEPLGRRFGYHIRFDRQASPDTRVLVVTEGIFLRMLLDDPLLERVAVVVFDEFHERSLNSDLALALTRRLQTELRPELKIVAMSATFDPQVIAAFLGCPVVVSEGRLFPVAVRYLPFPSQRPLPVEAAAGVRAIAAESAGDILVFLPGVGEIRRTRKELETDGADHHFELRELYGELPADQQELVLRPSARRKIILATNVAETSVTVPGVTAVVDTGYARIMRCDAGVGLNRLDLCRISRASADQRAGRAGRLAPGTCLRLWAADEWRMFKEQESPEVSRLELSGALLQLHAWGERDPRAFPWFQAPPPAALDHAERLLERLGALHEGTLTPLGRQLAQLPVQPRLARLLCEGQRHRCVEQAGLAAALLSERDPFERADGRRVARQTSPSDLLDRVHALQSFAATGQRDSHVGSLHVGAAEHLLRVRDQLLRELRDSDEGATGRPPTRGSDDHGADKRLLRALVAAFPDRVARRREKSGNKGVMVGGRGVRLADSSAVREGDLFLCVDIEEVGSTEALVRQASRVEREWLPSGLLASRVEIEFDDERRRVVGWRRLRYEDLLLDEAATDAPLSPEVSALLAEAAERDLSRALALDAEPVQQFLARVAFLRQWLPDLNWPELGEPQLRELLPALCTGRRSFAELREAPLLGFLQGALTPQQLAALDREAPERLPAATGNRVRLQYEGTRPPVMAVRIQEMYGQLDTPRVAAGRVPVLLHLLAPNMRPQQVTDDLRGFWERAYPVIRKELRRRYPKHAWPDDPAHASPESRPQRKS